MAGGAVNKKPIYTNKGYTRGYNGIISTGDSDSAFGTNNPYLLVQPSEEYLFIDKVVITPVGTDNKNVMRVFKYTSADGSRNKLGEVSVPVSVAIADEAQPSTEFVIKDVINPSDQIYITIGTSIVQDGFTAYCKCRDYTSTD